MGRAEPKGRQPQFVHLRLHTEYSLVDGIVRVPRLMPAIAAAGMAAVALTDQCNLFAMVKFYRAAINAGRPDSFPAASSGNFATHSTSSSGVRSSRSQKSTREGVGLSRNSK